MPSSRPITSVGRAGPDRPNSRPTSGVATISGSPVSSQCAQHLAAATAIGGCGASSICSSEPSARSPAKSEFTDSIDASSAQTQTMPGAISRSICGSGPTPSGNRLSATMKNTSGSSESMRRRDASLRSRSSTVRKTPLMVLALAAIDVSARGGPRGANAKRTCGIHGSSAGRHATP